MILKNQSLRKILPAYRHVTSGRNFLTILVCATVFETDAGYRLICKLNAFVPLLDEP